MTARWPDLPDDWIVGGFLAYLSIFALLLCLDAWMSHRLRAALAPISGPGDAPPAAARVVGDISGSAFAGHPMTSREAFVSFPKAGNAESEIEDAGTLRPGVAAVSDGASSSFDSGRWASFLCNSVVEDWPEAGPEGFRAWLVECARNYTTHYPAPHCSPAPHPESNSATDIEWLAEATAGQPACATLLAVRLATALDGGLVWEALCIGDSVMLQLRPRGEEWTLVTGFPVERSAAIDGTPELMCSSSTTLAQVPSVRLGSGPANPDDLWLLMTDECARWALSRAELGEPIWALLAGQDRSEIETAANGARDARWIANDDMTVLCLTSPVPLDPEKGVSDSIRLC